MAKFSHEMKNSRRESLKYKKAHCDSEENSHRLFSEPASEVCVNNILEPIWHLAIRVRLNQNQTALQETSCNFNEGSYNFMTILHEIFR